MFDYYAFVEMLMQLVEDGLPINIFCPRISVNTWNVYRKER